MTSKATTVEEYLEQVPSERLPSFSKLRATILENLPNGFEETINYGMIGYVVPHQIYPEGYHCDPTLPLPFANLASQKNFIALYHMGLFASLDLLQWFTECYGEFSKTKLDMGKSCIRFKKPEAIPFDLIGLLMQKLTVQDWITIYESQVKR